MNARTAKVLTAAILAAVVVPASASAALPKPKDPTIEIPTSIGGTKIKQSLKTADRAWGRTGECSTGPGLRSCTYAGDDPLDGSASIEAAVHKQVSSIAIAAGQDDEGAYVFQGRILRFETPEGIGLGDPGKRVRKAYPEAIKTANGTGYLIPGRGKSYMTVQTFADKRITAMTLVDGRHQG